MKFKGFSVKNCKKQKKKTNVENGKENKGITLIALVITIIVLLILAGITINSLTGGDNAMQKAQEAKINTDNSNFKEQLDIAVINSTVKGYSGNIDKEILKEELEKLKANGTINNYEMGNNEEFPWMVNNGKFEFAITGSGVSDSITRVAVTSFSNLNKEANLPSDKNVIVTKGEGDSQQQIVIPAGFEMAEDTGTTLETGLVIKDVGTINGEEKAGNEFVWVPVNQKIQFQNTDENGNIEGIIQLGRYDFGTTSNRKLDGPKDGSETIDTTYNLSHKATETLDKSVARDIEDFKTQTKVAKGYYIGRYEMGKNEDIAVCKKEVPVYNEVTRNKAKEESQNLYNDVKKEGTIIYTSDLINSYAWDTALVYIMKCDKEGNEYAYQNDDVRDSAVVTGEKADIKCNINDMAKNVCEWTTEYSSNPGSPCVLRGGTYGGSNAYTIIRGSVTTNYSGPYVGFRPILYIVGLTI